jgi:hypothetical protein
MRIKIRQKFISFLFVAFASRRRPRGLQIRIQKMQKRPRGLQIRIQMQQRPRGHKRIKQKAKVKIRTIAIAIAIAIVMVMIKSKGRLWAREVKINAKACEACEVRIKMQQKSLWFRQ